MKLYKREIKPMIEPPALQGMKWQLMPVPNFNKWYPEEKEQELRRDITISDPYWTLTFDERYVETDVETSATCAVSDDSDEYYGKWLKCDSCGYDHNVIYNKYCGNCGKELVITRKEDFMLRYVNSPRLEE